MTHTEFCSEVHDEARSCAPRPRRFHVTTPAVLALAITTGCASPEPERTPSTQTIEGPLVQYDLGFLPEERDTDGSTWRWMGHEGIVRLRNTRADMVLSIKGSVPAELPIRPTVTLSVNDEPLDTIENVHGTIERTYEIGAAKLGSRTPVVLRLLTSTTFVPQTLDPASQDTRRLGFAVYNLSWTPK